MSTMNKATAMTNDEMRGCLAAQIETLGASKMTIKQRMYDAIDELLAHDFDVRRELAFIEKMHQKFHAQAATFQIPYTYPLKVKKPVIEAVIISPLQAMLILLSNPANRRLRQRPLETLVNEIRKDKFELNGACAVIADAGELNDAQQRLWAGVIADKSIAIIMALGVSRGSRSTVDMGAPRTAADILSLEGKAYASQMSTIAGMLNRFENDQIAWKQQSYVDSKQNNTRYVFEHEEEIMHAIERNVAVANKMGARIWNACGGLAVVSFIHIALCRMLDDGTVEEFIDGMVTGENLPALSPILAARNAMLERGVKKGPLTIPRKIEIITRAFEAWYNDEPRKVIKVFGSMPEFFKSGTKKGDDSLLTGGQRIQRQRRRAT